MQGAVGLGDSVKGQTNSPVVRGGRGFENSFPEVNNEQIALDQSLDPGNTGEHCCWAATPPACIDSQSLCCVYLHAKLVGTP